MKRVDIIAFITCQVAVNVTVIHWRHGYQIALELLIVILDTEFPDPVLSIYMLRRDDKDDRDVTCMAILDNLSNFIFKVLGR